LVLQWVWFIAETTGIDKYTILVMDDQCRFIALELPPFEAGHPLLGVTKCNFCFKNLNVSDKITVQEPKNQGKKTNFHHFSPESCQRIHYSVTR
jgi:hypothetical protein